jgi:hypothetical protein
MQGCPALSGSRGAPPAAPPAHRTERGRVRRRQKQVWFPLHLIYDKTRRLHQEVLRVSPRTSESRWYVQRRPAPVRTGRERRRESALPGLTCACQYYNGHHAQGALHVRRGGVGGPVQPSGTINPAPGLNQPTFGADQVCHLPSGRVSLQAGSCHPRIDCPHHRGLIGGALEGKMRPSPSMSREPRW